MVIVKKADKFELYSKHTHRHLGEFSSLEKAKQREQEIEFFKHRMER
jgi:N-acetyl-gamma-glutamylphosphate reductase